VATCSNLIVLVVCLAAFSSWGSAAEPKPDKPAVAITADKQHQSEPSGAQLLVTAGISVSAARQLAGQHQLIGASALPPGMRKQLSRGKPLPPGLARRINKPAFVAALPQHPGHEWQICGTDLVLVAVATAVVADILQDVFR